MILATVGFLLVMVGGTCIDSKDNTIPMIITLVGLAMMALELVLERRGR